MRATAIAVTLVLLSTPALAADRPGLASRGAAKIKGAWTSIRTDPVKVVRGAVRTGFLLGGAFAFAYGANHAVTQGFQPTDLGTMACGLNSCALAFAKKHDFWSRAGMGTVVNALLLGFGSLGGVPVAHMDPAMQVISTAVVGSGGVAAGTAVGQSK